MTLAPIQAADLDPMIAPHIGTGETVLWQGSPEIRPPSETVSYIAAGLLAVAGLGILAGLGPLVIPSLAMASGTTLVPGLVMVAAGLFFLFLTWRERAAIWRFALTDRRALLIRGNTVFRTAEPAEMNNLRIIGSTVYWRREARGQKQGNKRGNFRYIGFKGLRDPQAAKRLLEDWAARLRSEFSAGAASFARTLSDKGDDNATAPGITRVKHPGTGLSIDVPSGWSVTVSNDYDGPLKVFGIQILPRIIRPGEQRAYGDGRGWTTLQVRGAVDAGLTMIVRNAPMSQTLESVVNDPWNEKLGLEVLQTTPEITIGPFNGFSVARRLPAGGQLTGFGAVGGDVATRMIWLGDGARSIEFTGLARLDQPEVQHAVNAMVDSLGLR